MSIIFFAVVSMIKTSRRTGKLITGDLFEATMAGSRGSVAVICELLLLFTAHSLLYLLPVRVWLLSVVHVIATTLALEKTKAMAPLTTMAYLMMAIVFQLKYHSYVMTTSERKDKQQRFKDYIFHILSPHIVYHTDTLLSRSDHVDVVLLVEKLGGALLCWLSAHYIIEQYLMPQLSLVPSARDSLDTLLFDIYPSIFLPSILTYLLLFLMVFEFWLSALAIALRLQDCHFFSDWWNSGTFADFSRKWNIPVHAFIKRHIYSPAVRSTGSKRVAMLWCFLVSAVLHEFVIWVALGRRWRHPPIIFSLQLSQIPLSEVGRALGEVSPFLANMFFWFGMIFAPPLIMILYIRSVV
jgi:hypothetical protein